jgi:hypothetical protein
MPNTGPQHAETEGVDPRRYRRPRYARLGKTWQDRSWRQRLLADASSSELKIPIRAPASNRRALPARH